MKFRTLTLLPLFLLAVVSCTFRRSNPQLTEIERRLDSFPEEMWERLGEPELQQSLGSRAERMHYALLRAEAMNKTMEFLKGSMPFFVATVEQGLPRVRPTGVVTFFQDKIWFHVGQSKGVYQQILQDPHVEIVSVGKDREWIRISGEATCVDDEAVSNQALDSRPHLKTMYNEQTGQKLGNFYFEHALVELSKADGSVELYKW